MKLYLNFVVLCCAVSHFYVFRVMFGCVMSRPVLSCHVILCYVTLGYVMLCCVALRCVVLCCVVLVMFRFVLPGFCQFDHENVPSVVLKHEKKS